MKAAMTLVLLLLILGLVWRGSAGTLASEIPHLSTSRWTKHYSVIDLPPIPGARAAQAQAVSHGHVAGYSVIGAEPGGTEHATLWKDGIAEDLGPGIALAINEYDQVAGYEMQGDGTFHAMLWAHGVATDLGTLSGFDSSTANGISNNGEIVGSAFTLADPTHQVGFRWTRKRGMRAITGSANALGINAEGDIAGVAENSLAAIFTPRGAIVNLGTLGSSSIALALNNRVHAVGSSSGHAFFYDKRIRDLGTLSPGDSASANAINDSDLVVGSDGNAVLGARAFVWSRAGGMKDLNTLISDPAWTLLFATGIDQRGRIVGGGVLRGTVTGTHGFLLIPDFSDSRD